MRGPGWRGVGNLVRTHASVGIGFSLNDENISQRTGVGVSSGLSILLLGEGVRRWRVPCEGRLADGRA